MSAPAFDLEAVYDREIGPLMTRIIEICKRHKMPMLATFNYRQEPEGSPEELTAYCTTVLGHDDWLPDEIEEAAAVIRNGGSMRPKVAAITIKGGVA